jgi:hypothetical protein
MHHGDHIAPDRESLLFLLSPEAPKADALDVLRVGEEMKLPMTRQCVGMPEQPRPEGETGSVTKQNHRVKVYNILVGRLTSPSTSSFGNSGGSQSSIKLSTRVSAVVRHPPRVPSMLCPTPTQTFKRSVVSYIRVFNNLCAHTVLATIRVLPRPHPSLAGVSEPTYCMT